MAELPLANQPVSCYGAPPSAGLPRVAEVGTRLVATWWHKARQRGCHLVTPQGRGGLPATTPGTEGTADMYNAAVIPQMDTVRGILGILVWALCSLACASGQR